MPELTYLTDVLIILSAAIVFVLVMQRLRASPVIGYLAAGIVIGPHAGALIKEAEVIHSIAEFGVVFLLFSIGLELPFRRLLSMRWYIFGLGLAQVFVTSLVLGGIAYLLGIPLAASLAIGGALALSSTATVLQLLIERGDISARFGRITVAVLIFQDLAVVPLLVLIPLLAGETHNILSALAIAGAKGAITLVVILLLGRIVVRPFFHIIAKTRNAEVFTATTLLIVLGISLATAQAGMSMALGAFLAGLLMAETQYRHHVEADIKPFRGLFLGLFFMTVGMMIDIGFVQERLLSVVGLTIMLILGKAFILSILARIFGISTAVSGRVGLLLAQGSEFGFVLFGLAVHQKVVSEDVGQMLLAVIALSMMTTPLLFWLGKQWESKLKQQGTMDIDRMQHETDDLSRHVIIAGFGRVGRIIAKILSLYHIPYVVLDNDAGLITRVHDHDFPVYYGDARRIEVLKALGLDRAYAVIVALDAPEDAEHLVEHLHEHNSELEILVRGYDRAHQKRLESYGATVVVPEVIEPSLTLGAAVLRRMGHPSDEIERMLGKCREDNYALLDD